MNDLNPTERVRTFYQKYAPRYDHETGYYDRVLLGDGRAWVCGQARGSVLEVAVGTGRNLPFYPRGIRHVGIDLTPAMLAIARDRAHDLGIDVNLLLGDALEMYRVLRPGGKLLLLGHVASHHRVVGRAAAAGEEVGADRG